MTHRRDCFLLSIAWGFLLVAAVRVSADSEDEIGNLLEDILPPASAPGSELFPDERADAHDLDAILAGNTPPSANDGGDADLDALLDGTNAPGEKTKVFKFEKGFFDIEAKGYTSDGANGHSREELIFDAEAEWSLRLSEQISGYFRPRLYVDLADTDLHRFEPYEAYLSYTGDAWDLRLGQFVENWGIADTFNPIDILNRRDLATDMVDPKRLGEFGLRYRKQFASSATFGEPTLSLYALPIWRETRFAPDGHRFGIGTEAMPFDEGEGIEPSGIDRAFFAVRGQSTFNSQLANADLQLVAARGPNRTPSIQEFADGTFKPVYNGAWSLGAGFRAVPNQEVAGSFLSSLTLKGEFVYQKPFAFDGVDQDVSNDYLAYVVGVDRLFYGTFVDTDQLTLTLEYAGELGGDAPHANARPIRNDVIARVLWEGNDFNRSSLELRALIDLDHGEKVYEAVFERQMLKVHEDLKWTLRYQHFDQAPPGERYLASFPDNSAVMVGIKMEF